MTPNSSSLKALTKAPMNMVGFKMFSCTPGVWNLQGRGPMMSSTQADWVSQSLWSKVLPRLRFPPSCYFILSLEKHQVTMDGRGLPWQPQAFLHCVSRLCWLHSRAQNESMKRTFPLVDNAGLSHPLGERSVPVHNALCTKFKTC